MVLIHGAIEAEHDQGLEAVLQRCKWMNLTLNKEKCEFNVKEVTYFGQKLVKNGIKPDEEKLRQLKAWQHQLTSKE